MSLSDVNQANWERCVDRRYDLGGHLIALNTRTVEIDDQLVTIEVGQVLTREQAKAYTGDVQHVFRRDETSGSGVYEPATQ